MTTTGQYASLAKDCYLDHGDEKGQTVLIDGVQYTIIDTISKTASGFQGTAYQRLGGNEIAIAYRGTEAGKDHFRDDRADFEMVRDRTNDQLADADGFTRRVMDKAAINASKNHIAPPTITVTGHSLGGTLAEIMAARYNLGGETFNAYGAVDLAYGVPEGMPTHAPALIDHVRATDVVSAASRHYGQVRIYATAQDVDRLRHGRYLDRPDSLHATNPLLTGSLGAHFVSNFAPDPGQGESILTPANEARYRQYQPAFDHYRHDVLSSRTMLAQMLNGRATAAQSAPLHAMLGDAAGVAAYHHVVGQAEALTGLSTAEARYERLARASQGAGELAREATATVAGQVRAGGAELHGAGESIAHAAHEAGWNLRESGDVVAARASSWSGLDPITAAGLTLTAKAAGTIGAMGAEGLAQEAHLTGTVAHGAAELVAERIDEAGQTTHTVAAWVSGRAHETAQHARHLTETLASTQAFDSMRDGLAHRLRLDHPHHPDYPLFQQAREGVHQLDAARGRTPDHHSANLAGALTAAAKAEGLSRIDRVLLSEDGSRAFASQQGIGPLLQRHAMVDTAQAVHTSIEQSTQRIASIETVRPPQAAALAREPAPVATLQR